MAIEGADGAAPVVDPNVKADTGSKPDGGQPGQKPNPDPDLGNKDGAWARERSGLTADLQKERKARQALDAQIKSMQDQLEASTKRVQALAGVNPQSDDEADAAEIRQKFGAVFKQLSKLDDPDTFQKLEQLLTMFPALQRTVDHHWGAHSKHVLTAIEKKIAEQLGGELGPRQIKAIRSAYVLEAQTNPEFATRHEEDSAALIDEFSKQWVEDWIEPARRKATADELSRQRRVPGARDRNLVTGPGEKPIDVTNATAVEDALVAGFKAKGGEFGRR